jgi:hypothetical protein
LIIGADRVLSVNGKILDKPKDRDGVGDSLFALRGKTHQLHSAVALVEGPQVIWTHIETAHLTMRQFSPEFLGRYLAAAGTQVYQPVGGYQLDGLAYSFLSALKVTTSRPSNYHSSPCLHAFARTGYWRHDSQKRPLPRLRSEVVCDISDRASTNIASEGGFRLASE